MATVINHYRRVCIEHENRQAMFDPKLADNQYLTPVTFTFIPDNLFWLHFKYGLSIEHDITLFRDNGTIDFYIVPSKNLNSENLKNGIIDIMTIENLHQKAQEQLS